ncbi:MAG: hypothetical protein QNJ72_24070 [Pleurocapsa sp. MO_226.B13]|nr:hypothetical protein [Pleurocapsa sp. MO_226.B13]
MEEREATPNNASNDIDASSEFGLDGSVNITIFDASVIEGATKLPNNVVEPEQTVAQTCQTDRLSGVTNSLTIEGKGGIPAEPGLPLDSQNISINDENTNSTSTIPEPIETAQGKIQPARGVIVTESGEIILTAYRTDRSGGRLPSRSLNCGRV